MTSPERDRLLVTFGPMLPITLVGDLLGAIGPTAERAGWTAVGINSALEIRGTEPPAGGGNPFDPVADPCRECGDAKADHQDGRCAGDFLHCPCTRWAGSAAGALHDFKVGEIIHGFCGGSFGRDSYACRRVETVGPDWVVTRNGLGDGSYLDVELAAGENMPSREQAADKSYCDIDCDGPDER